MGLIKKNYFLSLNYDYYVKFIALYQRLIIDDEPDNARKYSLDQLSDARKLKNLIDRVMEITEEKID